MKARYLMGAAAVVLGFASAGSQAMAADITTNLGVISPGSFYDVISVDQTGILGYGGPGVAGTDIQINSPSSNNYSSVAPTTGVYDFTFSVAQASTLNTSVFAIPGFGTASVDLLKGSSVVGSDLTASDTVALSAGTQYTLAVTGNVSGAGLGLDVLTGSVSAVPLPGALPLFASAIAGFAGFRMRKQRRNNVA
jgi:hypothetical protein